MQEITGLRTIADRYDAFIVDVWGVLHDGTKPYDGVLPTLQALRQASKPVLLLSNAARRSESVTPHLEGIGVPRALYQDMLTSGDETWRGLKTRGHADAHPFYRDLGRRGFVIGAGRDPGFFDALDVERVEDPAASDFILANSLVRPGMTPADFEDVMQAARGNGAAFICANPDLVVVYAGKLEYCPGSLAARYEELGGSVMYHGKPHAPVYARALAMLGDPDPRRVLCVGDSLRTDIAGAGGAGLDSLLLAGGIHKAEFLRMDGTADTAAMIAAAEKQGVHPTWLAGRLDW
ncbi:MAG: TIGR01459 family HAD-type hydrolase [Reyranellaceae bacterium]